MSEPPTSGPTEEPRDPGEWSLPPQQPNVPPPPPSPYAPPPPPPPSQPPYAPQDQSRYQPYPFDVSQPQQPPSPPGQWDYLGGPAPLPVRRRRGRLIASLVAVVALAAGGVATYVAVSQSSSSGGGSSPQQAIRNIVTDINRSDLIGVLGDLAPGERTALAGPITDDINALKRTNVLNASADPHSVAGLQIHIGNLVLSSTAITLASDVSVVEIGGGTLDVNADLSKVPFTRAFLDAVFPTGLPAGSTTHQSVDLTRRVQASGKTYRIATQKVNGRWYPSLFYTIAYEANNEQAPAASDYIAPHGAPTPDMAVQSFINDLLSGDVAGAIALTSPDELAVLHTYGGVVTASAHYSATQAHVDAMTFDTAVISAGKRLTLRSMTTTYGGKAITINVNAGCVTSTSNGSTKRQCPDDVVTQLLDVARNFVNVKSPTPAQRTALRDLVSGFTSVGLDVSQSGGLWYVSPVRSMLDLAGEIYSHMRGNDLIEIVKYVRSIGH